MAKGKHNIVNKYGDEAPGWKDFVLVLVVFLVLTLLSWLAYYKFGWFH